MYIVCNALSVTEFSGTHVGREVDVVVGSEVMRGVGEEGGSSSGSLWNSDSSLLSGFCGFCADRTVFYTHVQYTVP